jgi:hypothetical protein
MQLAADYLSADPAQHLANPQHTQIMQQLLVSSQKDQQTELKVLLLKYYKERLQEGGSLE